MNDGAALRSPTAPISLSVGRSTSALSSLLHIPFGYIRSFIHSSFTVHLQQFTESILDPTRRIPLLRWSVLCFLSDMRVFNSVLALLLTSSLVAASPVAFEKRADNGNVVVVTHTDTITRTTHAANQHRVTRTVTVYASMVAPVQRPALDPTTPTIVPTTPSTTVESPAVESPAVESPAVESPTVESPSPALPSTLSTSDTPATPATPSAAAVANDGSAASALPTSSSGLFSGQGTFYSTGLAPNFT